VLLATNASTASAEPAHKSGHFNGVLVASDSHNPYGAAH
jgi:hypothetical protein